jgi:LacI family transcriptional regulator
MDKRPTIIDVATLAGVSKSTVSLVLQNSPLVRQETRDDVRRAMAQLGYVYNRAAANLRSANAGLIGVVINDLRNPFFTEFATSLQMALSARGYATVLANTDEDPALQGQVVGAMLEHGVSALIVSPAYGEEAQTFDAIARANVPALQVLRQVVPTERFPFAAPDYPTGSRLATEHLLQQGAKRIAFVGGLEGRAVTQARMSGYLDTLAAHGLRPLHLPGRPGRAFANTPPSTLSSASTTSPRSAFSPAVRSLAARSAPRSRSWGSTTSKTAPRPIPRCPRSAATLPVSDGRWRKRCWNGWKTTIARRRKPLHPSR